ncbi:hypothetical protein XENTR_v10020692 [Xenopus tropicalis]|nr:hypothetical protein XENTR_v10020692 [Xenopus tropicalis]
MLILVLVFFSAHLLLRQAPFASLRFPKLREVVCRRKFYTTSETAVMRRSFPRRHLLLLVETLYGAVTPPLAVDLLRASELICGCLPSTFHFISKLLCG